MEQETTRHVHTTNGATPPAPKRVWEARTGSGTDPLFLAYSESIAADRHFVDADLAGSIAHVAGLAAAKILSDDEARTLVAELQALWHAYHSGNFVLDPQLEDVHMNIEAKVTENLGPLGAKLHTGRSRNDQVATCLVLHARKRLAEIAIAAGTLTGALIQQAEAHVETPWVARTHGQPGQPATLGFFLAAHAYRVQAAAADALAAFHKAGESPLGAGAVAGSTLPLVPAKTAALMGLRPLRNALLATGTRDVVSTATAACATLGGVAASLAEDLLQLTRDGAFRSPHAFTSGSSLMPQKRNPDALELARGKGKALLGVHVQVQQIVGGLPLGYHRDFQETKPPLVAALDDALITLQVLAAVVAGGRFVPERLAKDLESPGIAATDVAEALVANGVAFRTAYTAVAKAAQSALDDGLPFAAVLETLDLPAPAVQAAVAAATPDPVRRATLGGPAPQCVTTQLDELGALQEGLVATAAAAHDAASIPFTLLSLDPHTIVSKIHEDNE